MLRNDEQRRFCYRVISSPRVWLDGKDMSRIKNGHTCFSELIARRSTNMFKKGLKLTFFISESRMFMCILKCQHYISQLYWLSKCLYRSGFFYSLSGKVMFGKFSKILLSTKLSVMSPNTITIAGSTAPLPMAMTVPTNIKKMSRLSAKRNWEMRIEKRHKSWKTYFVKKNRHKQN